MMSGFISITEEELAGLAEAVPEPKLTSGHPVEQPLLRDSQSEQEYVSRMKEENARLKIHVRELSRNCLIVSSKMVTIQEKLAQLDLEKNSLLKQNQHRAYLLREKQKADTSSAEQVFTLRQRVTFMQVKLQEQQRNNAIVLQLKDSTIANLSRRQTQLLEDNRLLQIKVEELTSLAVELKNNESDNCNRIGDLERQAEALRTRVAWLQESLEQNQMNKKRLGQVETLTRQLQEMKMQNNTLRATVDELEGNEGLIIVFSREIEQLRAKVNQVEEKQAMIKAEEQGSKLAISLLVEDYQNFFLSQYFRKEMESPELALRSCLTVAKVHFFQIRQLLLGLSSQKEREEIFQEQARNFIEELRVQLNYEKLVEMV